MCGIAGLVDFSLNSSREDLVRITDSLLHRGPDSSGYELIKTDNCVVGLGHRRLSIIDLSDAGHQPMSYAGLSLIFNGEVYNFQSIRDTLELNGYVFDSLSDTEVVLKAYHFWGVRFVDKLNGMFSFAVLDREKKELFLYRDRAGVKPLFLYEEKGFLLFSSEIKSFHEHPRFKKEINLESLALYLKFGYIPNPHSIFKNVYKVKPGNYVQISLLSGERKTVEYWNVADSYNSPKVKIDYKEAKQELRGLLVDSFKARMIADVRVGVFLSGGYDSSAVAAMIQQDSTEKLKTFTIGFEDAAYDESKYAKSIAKYLGTEHYEYTCTTEEAQSIIPAIAYYYDEPFADSSAIPTMLVSKFASKEVKVALSADGGDETFAGYYKYPNVLKNFEKYKNLPKWSQSALAYSMEAISFKPFDLLGFDKKHRLERNYFNMASAFKNGVSPQVLLKNMSQKVDDLFVKKLIREEFVNEVTSFDLEEKPNGVATPLDTILSIDYKTYLTDDILVKVDRATMSASIEGREPLLDYRIVDYVATLPDQYKIDAHGNRKFILKDITHEYLPKNLLDRPKKGFGVPVKKWLRSELKEILFDYLNEDTLERQGIFNVRQVIKLRDDYINGVDHDIEVIWFILIFQLWHARWID